MVIGWKIGIFLQNWNIFQTWRGFGFFLYLLLEYVVYFYIIVIHDEDQILMLILYSLYIFASNIYCNRYREHPRKIRPILDILQFLVMVTIKGHDFHIFYVSYYSEIRIFWTPIPNNAVIRDATCNRWDVEILFYLPTKTSILKTSSFW